MRDLNKMMVFDLDNTILQERFIEVCARQFNFSQALALVRQIDNDSVSLAKRMAGFLKGLKRSVLMDLAANIPIVTDTMDVFYELRQRGYYIGIISDSYQFVTQVAAKKINADFELSNQLQFSEGIATGEVLIPSYFQHTNDSLCRHQSCKTNALRHICRVYQVKLEDCIVVSDSEHADCIVKHAGMGISFCTTNELLRNVAKKHIGKKSFSELLDFAH